MIKERGEGSLLRRVSENESSESKGRWRTLGAQDVLEKSVMRVALLRSCPRMGAGKPGLRINERGGQLRARDVLESRKRDDRNAKLLFVVFLECGRCC